MPPNPYGGYPAPGMGYDPGECALAKQALIYAIVGLFCCGPILGGIAISKARSAQMIIAGTPGMRGGGMAQAAMIIGILDIVLTVIAFIINLSLH